ncbi:unnamed protein product [marine sediment metagenome]|uniref:Uncharacterized protein n=1 Tax=marine sediment metagenome TaxID=412755 RepID=X0WWZ6_9ZZZZ
MSDTFTFTSRAMKKAEAIVQADLKSREVELLLDGRPPNPDIESENYVNPYRNEDDEGYDEWRD